MRLVHVCEAVHRVFSIEVPSGSDPKTTYKIKGTVDEGSISCSCPGFKFRTTCRHLTIKNEKCGWDALSGEEQSQEQAEKHLCPRCGSKTIEALRGNVD